MPQVIMWKKKKWSLHSAGQVQQIMILRMKDGEGNGSPLQYSCLENPIGCRPWGCEGSDTTERLHFHFSLSCIGEGNGNPLQCSCLENPRDGRAWWTAIYGVTQSRTRLKQLSSSSSSSSSSRMKDRILRERWHSTVGDPYYTETWDCSTYFRTRYHPLLTWISPKMVLVWPHRVKHSPAW